MSLKCTTVEEANEILKCRNDFNSFLNIDFLKYEDGFSESILRLRPELLNPYGTVHGGILFSFADTIAGITAFMRGREVVTLNSSINYIAPAKGTGVIKGIVKEVKYGSKIAVYHVDIYSEEILAVNVELNYYII